MGKWEGLGFNYAMVLKIVILLVIAFFVICYMFKYLIKSNKLKPSKITRIFYLDDEEFVKVWERDRNKGKFKSVLYNGVIISITIWLTSLLVIVVTDGDFSKLERTLPAFIGILIGNTIGYPLRWNRNEEKYYELTRNKE